MPKLAEPTFATTMDTFILFVKTLSGQFSFSILLIHSKGHFCQITFVSEAEK